MNLIRTEYLEVGYLATFVWHPFSEVGFIDTIDRVDIVFRMWLISLRNIHIVPHIEDGQLIMPTDVLCYILHIFATYRKT